jgi:pyridinium-3,5-biscarboxylic acid mononucleotide synthase
VSGSEFTLDFDRPARIGFAEAVYAAGKTPQQLAAILDAAAERGGGLLVTRLDEDKFLLLPERLRVRIDYDAASRTAFSGEPQPITGEASAAVLTAGTSDLPVAREVVRTLRYHGQASALMADIGVAGLWRLMRRLDEIRRHAVIIIAAGMDAALPSVVAGLIAAPVIAVPTSVGYGVAAGGRAALDALLASCAPGITVVNIDNGYGAACAALRLLRMLNADPSRHSPG